MAGLKPGEVDFVEGLFYSQDRLLLTVARFDHTEAALRQKLTLGGKRFDVVVDDQHRAWP